MNPAPLASAITLDPGRPLAEGVPRAAAVLAAGGLLILPTETVWAIATRADQDAMTRLARVRSLLNDHATCPATWHLGSTDTAIRALGPSLTPIQRRAIERLCPGPATLRVELEPRALAPALAAAGLAPGAANDESTMNLRVSAHPGAAAVFLRSQGVAGGTVAIGTLDGPRAHRTLMAAKHTITHAPIELCDAELAPVGRFSTVVRLPRRGGYLVDREGLLSAASVERRLTLRVLMVCTGNTCRSPMAEAIARAQVERLTPGSVPVHVASAGTAAREGDPITPQALEALAALGLRDAASTHGAHALTPEALDDAHVIFAMTHDHLRQIERIDPAAAARATLLDPSGSDVPDPFGADAPTYLRSAKAIQSIVAARLTQLSTGELGNAKPREQHTRGDNP